MDTFENTIPILDHNYKRLKQIVSCLKMPEKFDLINIDPIYTDSVKRYLKDLNISQIRNYFELTEIENILSHFGQLITSIKLDKGFTRFIDLRDGDNYECHQLIPKYCPNLEQIELFELSVTGTNTYGELLTISRKLRILKLKRCQVTNSACLVISRIAGIEVLDLESSKLTGYHLNQLNNLAYLNLKNCRNFKSSAFALICKAVKLKSLNILNCKQLSLLTFQTIIETQDALESITVGNGYWSKNFKIIGNVVSLREFMMRSCKVTTIADYLKELSINHTATLEVIDIHFCYFRLHRKHRKEIIERLEEFRNLKVLCLPFCSSLEDVDLKKIVNFFPKLEIVDISGSTFLNNGIVACVESLHRLRFLDISHCQVDRGLYEVLVDIRMEKECRHLLCVHIDKESTLKSWLGTEFYKSNKDIVKLSVEPMRPNYDRGFLQKLAEPKEDSRQPEKIKAVLHRTPIRLTNDCLYHVMSYLSFVDKLFLVLSGNYFDEIFQRFLLTEWFDMPKVIQKLTIRDARIVLERFGGFIRKLRLKTPDNNFDPEYHYLARKYCTNLFEFKCRLVEPNVIKEIIIATANSLQTITLEFEGATDDVLEALSRAANLKVLNLENTTASGKYLSKLNRLVELNLQNCDEFTSENFVAICTSNKLKTMNIQGCSQLDEVAFRTLIATQTDLERLTIGKDYVTTSISAYVGKLPHLIDIRLQLCHYDHIERCLSSLIENRCEHLRALEIDFLQDYSATDWTPALPQTVTSRVQENILKFKNLIYLGLAQNTIVDDDYISRLVAACSQVEILDLRLSSNLSEDGIVWAVRCLKNLRHFDVSWCSIDNALSIYHRILKIMKTKATKPLTLYIEGDYVMEAFGKTKEYENTKKYLVLSSKEMKDFDMKKYWKERRKPARTTVMPSTVAQPSAGPSLLDLPNNCLSRIMAHLDAIDQLKLSCLHNRFYELMQSKMDNFLFDMSAISSRLTITETRKILTKFAKHIKRVHFNETKDSLPLNYLNLLQPYFPQLIEIEIGNCRESFFHAIENLFASTKQLKIAKFNACRMSDEFINTLTNNKQLKVFDIHLSPTIGDHLYQFTNLIELNMERCYLLTSNNFMKICRSCNLESLDIRYCFELNDEAFDCLVETQTNLQQLSITTRYDGDNLKICQLSNLKHVKIEGTRNASRWELDIVLEELLRLRRYDILSLEMLDENSRNLNNSFDDIIEERINKFPNLRKFKFHNSKVIVDPYFSDDP